MDNLLLHAWAEAAMAKAQRLILREKSPPTAGAIRNALLPLDISPSGHEYTGLIRGLAGHPPAYWALAQFVLRPVVGLLLNINLDQLPGYLVAQRTGDRF